MLLDTAERMFARESVGGVSLRAIGRAAGVSSAGVLYHYPTKQALVAAVIARRGLDFGRRVRANLRALIAREATVSTRDVVDAILLPLVAVINEDPEGGLTWVKLFTQLAHADDDIWVGQVRTAPDVRQLFEDAFMLALPDYESSAVKTRLGIAIYSMLTSLATADSAGAAEPHFGPEGLDAEFVEQLARFTAAGMAAD